MTVRWAAIQTAVFCMASTIAVAQRPGPPVSDERKEWNQRYGQFADAILKRNSKAFRSMVAPDSSWMLIGNRTLKSAQMEAEFGRKFDAVKPYIQFTMNITKLTVTGNTANVERTQIISGFYNDAQGKRHRAFDGSGWEDRWVKTAQGWQLKNAKQFNETLTVDGRPGSPYDRSTKPKVPK